MRRWFRPKEKEQDHSREEGAASPAEEEIDTGPEAAAAVPETAGGELAASGPETPEEALPEPSPEEEAGEPPEHRPGFFRRLFTGAQAEEDAASSPADQAPEGQPELTSAPAPPAEYSPDQLAPQVPESAESELLHPDPALVPAEVPVESVGASEPPEPETAAAGEEPRRGLFRRLRERLGRTRDALAGGLDRIFAGRKEIDAALLDDLEELLITADLGVETSLHLIQRLQERLKRRELGDLERLKAALQAEMMAMLTGPPPPEMTAHPWVVLLVGVNGVGKTTTIAKLAYQDRLRGLSPLLVAADTFRAAAVEQLEIWGGRVGAPVIKQKTGADPAAVVFDGLAAAQARGADTVYIDTAGRLHTKVNLMEELKKIHRTAGKKLPGAPHEVLLIVDATTGQNALSQARLFHEAVGLTGIIITKLDGTAKGGVTLAVAHETGIPLRYLGVGEAMEDLRPFDAEAFVAAILG